MCDRKIVIVITHYYNNFNNYNQYYFLQIEVLIIELRGNNKTIEGPLKCRECDSHNIAGR